MNLSSFIDLPALVKNDPINFPQPNAETAVQVTWIKLWWIETESKSAISDFMSAYKK